MGINDLSVGVGKSKYLDRNEDWKGLVLGAKKTGIGVNMKLRCGLLVVL